MQRFGTRLIVSILASAALQGCSSGPDETALGLPSSEELGAVGALPSLASLTPATVSIPGSPTEVYTRIARGALTCWFGANGFLKGSYIYHADAQPPSKGGRSDIVIFAKDTGSSDPRALRAYRVTITPPQQGTEPSVGTENLKMPEPVAARMTADVNRWSSNQEGCGEAPVTAGWSASEPHAKAAAGKPKKN